MQKTIRLLILEYSELKKTQRLYIRDKVRGALLKQ